MIKEVKAGIISAMKAKDKIRLNTLRGIKSVADGVAKDDVRVTTDADIESAILTGIKQRTEAIKLYVDGGRQDLADIETEEVAILKEFLPTQLTEDEIGVIVSDAISAVKATSMKEMGKVMGYVNGKIAKGTADGSLIAKIVKGKLS